MQYGEHVLNRVCLWIFFLPFSHINKMSIISVFSFSLVCFHRYIASIWRVKRRFSFTLVFQRNWKRGAYLRKMSIHGGRKISMVSVCCGYITCSIHTKTSSIYRISSGANRNQAWTKRRKNVDRAIEREKEKEKEKEEIKESEWEKKIRIMSEWGPSEWVRAYEKGTTRMCLGKLRSGSNVFIISKWWFD